MIQKILLKKTLLTISMGIALGLHGCVGSDSSSGGVETGVFIDAPVQGLYYNTTTQSGVTNERGEFQYKPGEEVTFKIDGLEIGTVTAAPKVPVTDLPKFIEVARLLQSLDTDVLEERIDISNVKIPKELKTQLQTLLGENNDGLTFDGVLTQEQHNLIEETSQVQFVSNSPVTESDAKNHLINSLDDALTVREFNEADFDRQVYAIFEDRATMLFFNDDGTGFQVREQKDNETEESNNETEESNNKTTFDWVINDKKLVFTYSDGKTASVKLLNINGNNYLISVTNDEPTAFIVTFTKAKPFNLSALDGKTLSLKHVSINNNNCTERTLKVTGISASLKEICDGIFSETNHTLEDASGLDNTVIFRDTADGTVIKANLMQGDLNNGILSITVLSDQDSVANVLRTTITSTEVVAP